MDHLPMLLNAQRSRENEERFARANAQIEAKAESMEMDGEIPFLCECSDVRCTKIIHLSLDRYRTAKAYKGAFILLPGHDDANVERIVWEGDGLVLVEKYQ